jgi:hypothetical protein
LLVISPHFIDPLSDELPRTYCSALTVECKAGATLKAGSAPRRRGEHKRKNQPGTDCRKAAAIAKASAALRTTFPSRISALAVWAQLAPGLLLRFPHSLVR